MLLPLLMLLSSQPAVSLRSNPSPDPDPPIHVWLSSDGRYDRGDHAKVYARGAQDAYLIVLHASPDGRVRVLFPLDPRDEQRVHGGKKYELKGRGGHEAFMVDDTTGPGTVLAAVARSPFNVGDFAQNGRWDYDALAGDGVRNDPEAGLLGIVQRMQPADQHFDYDVATYVVATPGYASRLGPYPYPVWWGYGARFGFGWPYYWGYAYRWGRWHR